MQNNNNEKKELEDNISSSYKIDIQKNLEDNNFWLAKNILYEFFNVTPFNSLSQQDYNDICCLYIKYDQIKDLLEIFDTEKIDVFHTKYSCDSTLKIQLRPLYEAIKTIDEGDVLYLNSVAHEIKVVSIQIINSFDDIDINKLKNSDKLKD